MPVHHSVKPISHGFMFMDTNDK